MKQKYLTSLLILFLLLPGFFSLGKAAPLAVGITGVSPNSAPNNISTVLSLTGTDFVDGASVSLEGYGPLATTFVSATSLNAVLPVGVPAGTYNVIVTLPDTSQASLPGGLTVTAVAAPTSTATVSPGTYERPVIVVLSYSTSSDNIRMGQEFDLYVTIYNSGQHYARNIVATFTPGQLIPRKTGGVVAVSEIAPGNRADFTQPLTASSDLWGVTTASLTMNIAYSDAEGVAYTEGFALSIPIAPPKVGAPTSTPTPTPTPTSPPYLRPQLVISNYTTSVEPLQPGVQFKLDLQLQNVGNDLAKRVTMIVGGGSASSSASATLEPGGISGASGEFTNFAPIGASNIQSLGDLPAGQATTASQSLIVNTSTVPGAYPMRISFTYLNEKGNVITDEQVITLLVYMLPNLDIGFYRTPDPFFPGQPNLLPLQVVNLGRRSVVLGNLKVTAQGVEISNNVILVGTLDVGMYFTLDATLLPAAAGPLDLLVTVDYTDDFNQAQVISRTLTVDVQEMTMPEPGMEEGGGGVISPELPPETLWQKVLRFFKGLLGLGSDRTQSDTLTEMPVEEVPAEAVPGGKPLKGP